MWHSTLLSAIPPVQQDATELHATACNKLTCNFNVPQLLACCLVLNTYPTTMDNSDVACDIDELVQKEKKEKAAYFLESLVNNAILREIQLAAYVHLVISRTFG